MTTRLADLRAQALCKHQNAVANAQRVFAETVSQIDADHRSFHEAYARQWDEVKSDPTHPSLHIIRVEYERSLLPPDHEPARHALAEAVYHADNDYHAELRRIAAEHGVQMSAAPLTTRGI